jgi:hypothetical protein
LEWGTVGGGKREWGGKGQVSLQATWDQSGQGSHHTQRRDSKRERERDLGTREGRQAKGKLTRELSRGLIKGFVPYALILSICIYISCYCVYVANKRIVFRL